MRLDLWLWAVRVFKTRVFSADAIREERVHVDTRVAKPGYKVKAGEIITIIMDYGEVDWVRTLRVLDAPPSRVGAKLVPQFAEDLTTAEELAKRLIPETVSPGFRPVGMGRPTKRERRDIDELEE
ncbi:MAG: ribosome-associated heat shock protein implicated in recycling of subunit [Chthoniobacteraceae bacterium]|nr:ribosome-associated heat shock protein implicated in recycling of subunit [Chthoniobacteraceae bacterium]